MKINQGIDWLRFSGNVPIRFLTYKGGKSHKSNGIEVRLFKIKFYQLHPSWTLHPEYNDDFWFAKTSDYIGKGYFRNFYWKVYPCKSFTLKEAGKAACKCFADKQKEKEKYVRILVIGSGIYDKNNSGYFEGGNNTWTDRREIIIKRKDIKKELLHQIIEAGIYDLSLWIPGTDYKEKKYYMTEFIYNQLKKSIQKHRIPWKDKYSQKPAPKVLSFSIERLERLVGFEIVVREDIKHGWFFA